MTQADTPRFGNYSFTELQQAQGLARLDREFLERLADADADLHGRLLDYRCGNGLDPVTLSELLLALAPHLEAFVAQLFGVEPQLASLRNATVAGNRILEFKKQFVQRRARRYRGDITEDFHVLDHWLDEQLATEQLAGDDREAAVAEYAHRLLADADGRAAELERLVQWCVLGRRDPAAILKLSHWTSFHLPQPVDHANLVPLLAVSGDTAGRQQCDPADLRRRDGFALTDPRMSAREVQGEIHYCIYCHDHDGDFCSKGFPEKKGEPERGYKTNPLGVTLTGCPLEEKISEMHSLKRDGHAIGALAVAMVDNPMIPATGHRICNDCMKGCIYQKQDPVNIPQIETRVLTDVLELPFGVEIYHLLTRWNPLRREQYLAQPDIGRRVLIAGLGPAGFTMAHHLTMAGCHVVGVDGLKLEPLPDELLNRPVRDYSTLTESLDERILTGFGGVAEYGITVRWDKNFLKLIYLTLARRPNFQAFGGVRLGGTVTLQDAGELGFDHVCIANGAGLPRVIPMENSLARGMRQANDFLMALQLTGAAKSTSIANLQVRLPAVVIGGGLTAVDTATEVQAYYIKQVEKILHRHDTLNAAHGPDHVRGKLDPENRAVLDEYLEHGRAVRAERERARAAGEDPDFVPLLREWGGVTLCYRRSLNESPAYLRNHEEVIQAMREGIWYVEGLEPVRAELDEFRHVNALSCQRTGTGETVTLPARSIFVAAGAFPNTIYEREYPGTMEVEKSYFRPHGDHAGKLEPVTVAQHCKSDDFGPFTSYEQNALRVSFIGDTHPVFHGSVVKAIASAQRSYPDVLQALAERPAPTATDYNSFAATMDDLFVPKVDAVNTDHPAVVELWVRAPMVARNFRAGQFFRLQTFESSSPVVDGTRLQIPLQTVSGAGVDGDRVRLVLLRMGPNPKIVARLKPGDPLVLMGPTGAPAHIEPGKTVLVVAGKWGAAVMLDLGPALRAAGNRVLMLNAFANRDELYYQDQLEQGADQVLWATANGPLIEARREQDIAVAGADVVALLRRYGDGELGTDRNIPLDEVDEILVMGSTGLLKGLKSALRGDLAQLFKPDVTVLGTVGSPMQCMLKGVCGQCLQWQVDPQTGERTRAVFSCSMQDQPLFEIDLDNLAARQGQNRLSELLTGLWVDHVLARETAGKPGSNS